MTCNNRRQVGGSRCVSRRCGLTELQYEHMNGEIRKIYYSGSMCEAHPFCFREQEQWANKCWLWRASLCCCITSEANLPIKGNGHDNKSINMTRKWPGSETRDDRTRWQSTQNLPESTDPSARAEWWRELDPLGREPRLWQQLIFRHQILIQTWHLNSPMSHIHSHMWHSSRCIVQIPALLMSARK